MVPLEYAAKGYDSGWWKEQLLAFVGQQFVGRHVSNITTDGVK